MRERKFYTINEMSEKTGVKAQTLRNWEKSGLLNAVEQFGVHRLFNNSTIKDVQKIQRLRGQGHSIENIRSMLSEPKKVRGTGGSFAKVPTQTPKAINHKAKTNYGDKSITELTEIAKEKGLKYFRQMNKAELVGALSNPKAADQYINQAKARTKERYGDKKYGQNRKSIGVDLSIIDEILSLNASGMSREDIQKELSGQN